jgi:hypothetical protein
MSRWTERITSHATLGLVKEFGARVDTAVTLEIPDEATIDGLRRLHLAYALIQARLDAMDPELVTPGPLDSMNPAVQTIVAELTAFTGDRAAAHVVVANKHLDVVLNHLATIPKSIGTDELPEIAKVSASYRASIGEHLAQIGHKSRELQTEADQARQSLGELKTIIDNEKQRITSVVSEFQSQFSKAQETRNTEFAAAREKHATDIASTREKQAIEFSTQIKSHAAEWVAFKEKQEKAAADFLAFMEGRQAEVDSIFGAIGSASLAGHFAKTADADAKSADDLRLLALALMGMMVVVGGVTLFHSLENPNLPWQAFVFRLAVAIVIAIPAVYAAQESSKHRRREQLNRKKQIELASLDAFLVHTPQPKRNEIKVGLTDKFFGQPDVPEKDDEVTRHELFNLISDVVKNLTKAK